ncbi:unnamed protein product, partial [Didymodactylos carnosus]
TYNPTSDSNTIGTRIQSCSASDLNVQDVSSDSESESALSTSYGFQREKAYSCIKLNQQQNRKQPLLPSNTDRNNDSTSVQRLSATTITSNLRPITACSLPSKPNDDWDPQNPTGMTISRRNPSCPVISSPTTYHNTIGTGRLEINSNSSKKATNTKTQQRLSRNHRKQSLALTSPSTTNEWKPREISPGSQVPSVFQTTSEMLGIYPPTDSMSPFRGDSNRRSHSTAKSPSSSIMITDENRRNFISLAISRTHQQNQSCLIGEHYLPSSSIVAITEDIFIGTLRSLQNERQLCKLAIDYLIDASNMRPDEIARKSTVGSKLPCTCDQQHSRCILTVEYIESQKKTKYLH